MSDIPDKPNNVIPFPILPAQDVSKYRFRPVERVETGLVPSEEGSAPLQFDNQLSETEGIFDPPLGTAVGSDGDFSDYVTGTLSCSLSELFAALEERGAEITYHTIDDSGNRTDIANDPH